MSFCATRAAICPGLLQSQAHRITGDYHSCCRPTDLVSGQQEKIARALASEPAVILADEPTANVDSDTAIHLLDLMQELNRSHAATFIFSTHDQRVMDRARRVVRLVDGQIEHDEVRD